MAKSKEVIIFICVFILASVVALYISYGTDSSPNSTVCFTQKCFSVEIADTVSKQTKGLMFRDSLGEDEGMLFVFPEEGTYNFWMKNMLIPLDILWINQNLEVIHIENAASCTNDPCQVFGSNEKAKYVLEINSGATAQNGISVGSKIEIK